MPQPLEVIMPAMNQIFVMQGGVWRVTYRNTGKLRISWELVGVLRVGHPGAEGEKPVLNVHLLDNKTVLTQEEFETYRRKTWPMDHEKGRNPNNTTLGVQSGSAAPRSVFKAKGESRAKENPQETERLPDQGRQAGE